MTVLEWLRVIVLGIIEGITEWLPVSSTAHLLLLDALWKTQAPDVFTESFNEMFLVVVQLGAIIAVINAFAYKLNPVSEAKTLSQKKKTVELWKKVLVGCIPVGIAGFFLNDIITKYLYNWVMIAAMLILVGILFLVIDRQSAKIKPSIIKFTQLDYKAIMIIGFMQVLSLIPGTSRSGITIIAALAVGCSRFIATEFSFYMAIPLMCAAGGYRAVLYFVRGNTLSADQFFSMLLAAIVAFGVSKLVVRFFLEYVRRHDFTAFAIYRIILGLIVVFCGLASLFS